MEPVTIYEPLPGGPIRRIQYFMPALAAVPGVHGIRDEVYGEVTNPNLYVPAASMLPPGLTLVGDPACLTTACPLPCEGAYAGQCEPDSKSRSMGRYGYNYDQLFTSTSINPNSRSGPMYNLIRGCTPLGDGAPGCAEGQPTYRMDQPTWVSQNANATYDPERGGVSLSEYKVFMTGDVNSALGTGDVQCMDPATVSKNDLCSILNDYYILVPDIGPSGRQAYLANTPAAACANLSSGYLCFVPRAFTYQFTITTPVGEVHETVGAVCPNALVTGAEVMGQPAVTIQNPVAASAEWWYRWVSRGLNDTLDQYGISVKDRSLVCVNNAPKNAPTQGGTLGPNAAITLEYYSPCAQWTLELYSLNAASGTTTPVLCR